MSETTKCCCSPVPAVPDKQTGNQQTIAQVGGRFTESLIALTGGWFRMGADSSPHPEDGEGPERDVFVNRYQLATTAVTIEEFAVFVDATGYRTLAERSGHSFVFFAQCSPDEEFAAPVHAPWWRQVPGACWHSPNGPWQTETEVGYPVTHVSRDDALAFCQWSGTRLPTEAEWEYAARGRLACAPFPWGDELVAEARHRANVWQGEFPHHNTSDDGYAGVAPVEAYGPQGFGHFNMIGNVWEWVADRFTHQHSPRATRNPHGPLNGARFVAKGGSYLCHSSYCTRYRTSSRQALPADTTAGNIGFRVACDSHGDGDRGQLP